MYTVQLQFVFPHPPLNKDVGMEGVYVVFGYHPCTVSIPTFLHLASLSGFWHSVTLTSFFIFNVFVTLYYR